MAAGAAEKFVWLSKTFSGSFLRAVYPSRVQVKFKGKQKPSFYCPRWDFARKTKNSQIRFSLIISPYFEDHIVARMRLEPVKFLYVTGHSSRRKQ